MWRLRNIRVGTNVAIFRLFFAIALLEVFRTGRWLRGAFWVAIGLFFLPASRHAGFLLSRPRLPRPTDRRRRAGALPSRVTDPSRRTP